jgi:hypothetical protein
MAKSATDAFQAWAQSRLIGCMFSRAMFRAPEKYHILVIDLGKAEDLPVAVAQEVARLIDDPQAEGAVLLLPQVVTPDQIVALLRHLEAEAGWLIRDERTIVDGAEYAVLGVDIPVGRDEDAEVLSELLVFADFAYLPITRRAPCTALTLRTKAAQSDTPLPGRTERRANLAAIHMDIPPKTFVELTKKSKDLRAELDGPDNPFARARVAIGVPAELWNS